MCIWYHNLWYCSLFIWYKVKNPCNHCIVSFNDITYIIISYILWWYHKWNIVQSLCNWHGIYWFILLVVAVLTLEKAAEGLLLQTGWNKAWPVSSSLTLIHWNDLAWRYRCSCPERSKCTNNKNKLLKKVLTTFQTFCSVGGWGCFVYIHIPERGLWLLSKGQELLMVCLCQNWQQTFMVHKQHMHAFYNKQNLSKHIFTDLKTWRS